MGGSGSGPRKTGVRGFARPGHNAVHDMKAGYVNKHGVPNATTKLGKAAQILGDIKKEFGKAGPGTPSYIHSLTGIKVTSVSKHTGGHR